MAGAETGRREPRQGRAALNRGRVLQAAVALADEVGVEAVSMRRLAQQLDVVPMALYKHVADKDALLDGMVDALLDEVEAPGDGLEPEDAVRARILAVRRVVLRHPWARRAIESRTRRSPAVLAHMDAVVGLLRAGGLSVDLAHHVMHALGNRIWGFSPELFDESRDAPPTVDAAAQAALMEEAAQRYPHIFEIVRSATGGDPTRSGCDEDFEFVFALDLLLDGAGRLRDQQWRPPRGGPAGAG